MNGLWHGKDEQAVVGKPALNEKTVRTGVAMDL